MTKTITKTNFEPINEDELVTVYNSERYTEVVSSSNLTKRNDISKYRKIAKTTYVDTETGEIIEHRSPTPLCKSISNFKSNFKDLRRCIQLNFYGDQTEKFITLTYSYPMKEPEHLSKDIQQFIKKFKRKYNLTSNNLKYIYIKEPQEKGSWHIHLLIKRLDNKPLIVSDEEIHQLWNLGTQIKIQNINNIDKLVWYFDITRDKKKAQRIAFYPHNIRIYDGSRNTHLEKRRMPYRDVSDLLKDKTLTYQQQLDISALSSNNEFNTINTVKYEQYHRK